MSAGDAYVVPDDLLSAAGLGLRFGGLADASAIVLAVSGGPDSMALMHLATRWAERIAGAAPPKLHVATVDHGFRPGSAGEAAFVAAAASDLGLPHVTLRWDGPKPTSRIQERARSARYALLADHARNVGAAYVLTGHHADDQAETVLMRLGRGSGVAGLAGMRRDSALVDGITLVRPLLDLPKETLVGFCRKEGVRSIEDPSNSDPAFARVRLRQQSAVAAALGLDRTTLVRLAERMRRADAALDDASMRLEARLSPSLRSGGWSAVLAPASEAAPEFLQRVLRRALGHVLHQTTEDAVRSRHLRLERLETLVHDLHAALVVRRPFRATLAGTRIVLAGDTSLEVTLEPPRRRGRARSGGGTAMPTIAAAELPRTLGSLGK